jgi:hypothetical protein
MPSFSAILLTRCNVAFCAISISDNGMVRFPSHPVETTACYWIRASGGA